MTNLSKQINQGYTLPVFAAASAVASLTYLKTGKAPKNVEIDLIKPPQIAHIKIAQIAKIKEDQALAITLSDPGDNLDLTRHTPIWALVELSTQNIDNFDEQIIIKGGEGIGKKVKENDAPAIYYYGKELLNFNLKKLLSPDEKVIVTIILPEGRELAKKTSNEAFGIVEGLSLLGTTGISQPLTSPAQLELYLEELNTKAKVTKNLVFCIGENGLSLAQQMGFKDTQLVKTANWLSPMLVQASLQEVERILLFGYHGKLIKLAGGIFHTHHHLADGRKEILIYHCVKVGLPSSILLLVFVSETTDEALNLLRKFDQENNTNWVKTIYEEIAFSIEQKTEQHITKHSDHSVRIGCLLFDRQRKIIVKSTQGELFLTEFML